MIPPFGQGAKHPTTNFVGYLRSPEKFGLLWRFFYAKSFHSVRIEAFVVGFSSGILDNGSRKHSDGEANIASRVFPSIKNVYNFTKIFMFLCFYANSMKLGE